MWPGSNSASRGSSSADAGGCAVEAPGVEAGTQTDERIALSAPIDLRERRASALQRPVRLDLVGGRGKPVRIADGKARLHDRQRLAVFVDGAERSAARSARSRRPAASIIRVGAKTLPPAGGSCSASAVIETRTASPMHHGSATERAHAVRDRPIRDPAPHAKSVPRASRRLKRPAQCESFWLSALNVAGGLLRARPRRPKLGQGAPRLCAAQSGGASCRATDLSAEANGSGRAPIRRGAALNPSPGGRGERGVCGYSPSAPMA